MKRYLLMSVMLLSLYFGCSISNVGNGNSMNSSQGGDPPASSSVSNNDSSSSFSSLSNELSSSSSSSLSLTSSSSKSSSSQSSSSKPITEINYDNGVLEASVLNDNYPTPYQAAVYFSPSKLAGSGGKSIVAIKFYYACENGSGASIGVYLYSVKSDFQQGNQLYSQSLQQYTIVHGWNTANITPFLVPSDGIWVVLYAAQWTSSECFIMDSASSMFQNGINVNQLNGVATDTIGHNHNFLIRIEVQ